MITRLRAKMATNENSKSQEFDLNNQMGVEGLEDNTVDSNGRNNTVAEHSQNRARGPSDGSEMNFAMLTELIKKQGEDTREETRKIIELQSVETVSYTHLDVYKRQ